MQASAAPAGPPAIYRLPSVPDGVRMVLRRWWIVLLVAAVGGGGAFAVSRKFQPKYESDAKVRLKKPSKLSTAQTDGDEEQGDKDVDPMELSQRLSMRLSSRTLIEGLAKHLEQKKALDSALLKDRKKLIDQLSGGISLHPVGGHIFQLTVSDRDPKLAHLRAGYLTTSLLQIHRSGYEQQARRLETFALEQVKAASGDLKKLEQSMIAFLEKNPAMRIKSLQSDDILGLRAGDRLRVRKRATVFTRSLDSVARKNPRLQAMVQRKRRLQAELRSLNERGSGATSAVRSALTEAKAQLASLRGEGKKDSHPLVKRALSRVKRLEQQLATAAPGARTVGSAYYTRVRGELRQVTLAIRKELRSLSRTVAAPKQDMALLEAKWSRLRRQYTTLSERLNKLQEVSVNATLKKNLMVYEAKKTASIMERPQLPDNPVGLTRLTIIAAGGVASLLAGLMLALGLGLLDIRLRRPEEISEGGWGLQLLAVLTNHRSRGRQRPRLRLDNLVLVSDPQIDRPAAAQQQAWDAESTPLQEQQSSKPKWVDGAATALYEPDQHGKPGGLDEAATDFFDGGFPGDTLDETLPQPDKPKWVDAAATVIDMNPRSGLVADKTNPDQTNPDMTDPDVEIIASAEIFEDELDGPREPGWIDQPTAFLDPHGSRVPMGAIDDEPATISPGAGGDPAPPALRVRAMPPDPPFAPTLFVATDPAGKLAEQMRLLAGRMQGHSGEVYRRFFGLLSWEEGVGKTTVAANVALAMAESQRRVLCIDACPGQASLTRALGVEPEQAGLAAQLQRWLDGSTEPWEVIQVSESLSLLPADAEARPIFPLISSDAFGRLIYDMSQIYDIVLVDTRALSHASDAVALQKQLDGYVLVTARNRSNRRGLREAISLVNPRRILGAVFNERG